MTSGGDVDYSSSEMYDTVHLCAFRKDVRDDGSKRSLVHYQPSFLVHFLGSMGSSAAATRRPSSANKLYVEHAFF